MTAGDEALVLWQNPVQWKKQIFHSSSSESDHFFCLSKHNNTGQTLGSEFQPLERQHLALSNYTHEQQRNAH
jgi:hypothetical protein